MIGSWSPITASGESTPGVLHPCERPRTLRLLLSGSPHESASPMYEVRVEAITGKHGDARILLREPEKAWFELNNDDGTPLPPSDSSHWPQACVLFMPLPRIAHTAPGLMGPSCCMARPQRENPSFFWSFSERVGNLSPMTPSSSAMVTWSCGTVAPSECAHKPCGISHGCSNTWEKLGISIPRPASPTQSTHTIWEFRRPLRKHLGCGRSFCVKRYFRCSPVRGKYCPDEPGRGPALEQAVAAVTEWTGTDSQKSLGGRSDAP